MNKMRLSKKTVAFILLSLQAAFYDYTYAAGHKSVYTIDITIPDYDPGNSEHFLISKVADWAHINDSDKRIFYVLPNSNYGTITITADGTSESKRYISLYNGNDTHPAKLSAEEQANVRLIFRDAHYWVVDRMSSIDHICEGYCHMVVHHSQNIIFNRLYLTNFYDGIAIKGTSSVPYTADIVIQNSRFDRMTAGGIDDDRVAIILSVENTNTINTIKDTKILNNEIKNCNDGIMPVRVPDLSGGHEVDYSGTIIDCNDIYVDTAVYTDGSGNHDPNGLYAWTENAIDLKAGSSDPDNPMIITNNHLWGYRQTDKNGGGSGSWAGACNGHYDVKNVIIKNNVVFDSNRGIVFAATEGLPYSIENATISGNILYDIGHDPAGNVEYANYFYESKNVAFEKNTIVGVNNKSRWFAHDNNEEGLKVSCNVVINSYEMTGTRSHNTTVMNNTFFNTIMQNPGDGKSFPDASSAYMADLTFVTDNYTHSPRDITLPGVLTTPSSPHDSLCKTLPRKAAGPYPSDTSSDVLTDVRLRWTARVGATSHDVYFGVSNPPAFIRNQGEATYTPGNLSNNTTYYWRVDERNEKGITQGKVWSFTTADSLVSTNFHKLALPADLKVTCFPNPAISVTYFRFDLPQDGRVLIRIYNLMGEEIAEVANTYYMAGSYILPWNAGKMLSVKGDNEIQLFLYQVLYKNQSVNGELLFKN